MKLSNTSSARGGTQFGFSMLETLVTLLIISIWLLGSAGVQTIAMKLNKTSALRSQAVLLASEIGERMENNKTGAVLGLYSYDGSARTLAQNAGCVLNPCTPAQLADFDIAEIYLRSADALPNSTVTITPVGFTSPVTNPITYAIKVQWKDRRTGQTYSDTSSTNEVLSYSGSKTVYKTPRDT